MLQAGAASLCSCRPGKATAAYLQRHQPGVDAHCTCSRHHQASAEAKAPVDVQRTCRKPQYWPDKSLQHEIWRCQASSAGSWWQQAPCLNGQLHTAQAAQRERGGCRFGCAQRSQTLLRRSGIACSVILQLRSLVGLHMSSSAQHMRIASRLHVRCMMVAAHAGPAGSIALAHDWQPAASKVSAQRRFSAWPPCNQGQPSVTRG